MSRPRALVRAATALAARPSLWPTALRMAHRTAPDRWWLRPPFLPLPTREYLDFRLQTQYGNVPPDDVGADLVRYLGWCRSAGKSG